MKDLITLFDILPNYLVYVYPGYITIYLYLFFRSKSITDSKGVIVKSVVISYIYVSILSSLELSLIEQNAILILSSCVLAYISFRITKSKTVKKILHKLGIYTTFYDNSIDALKKGNTGAWLCVYLKDSDIVYEGSLGNQELEPNRKNYITLTGYWKYRLDANGKPQHPYIEEYDDDHEEEVLIFWDEIKRIEKRKTT